MTRNKISREVREEIDQTPGWWDKQFHKLLVATNTDYTEYGEIEYAEEITFAHGSTLYPTRWPAREYLGCTCRDCKNARFNK
jgi:hypothetical protein